MTAIKNILFDLGNTLLYFDGHWPDIFAQADQQLFSALKNAGLALEEEAFKTEFRKRLNDYFAERESEFIEHTTAFVLRRLLANYGYEDPPQEVIAKALKEMYRASQTYWIPEDDCLPTLQALNSMEYCLGVVSNASDDSDVQTLVDNAGIRPHIDFALSSASCGIRKPNPRIFEIALENWADANPANTVMVGDTLGADILGARNANIYSVWITRRADSPGNQDHQDTISPDAKISTLAELPQLVDQLNK
ncbi:MAG: HAD family hydrolase [Chloroflexota bacterium]